MRTILALTFFTALSALAQPNGQFIAALGSPVYDVSGTHYGYEEDTTVRFDVEHGASGALAGQAIAEYEDGFVYLSGIGPVTGKVTGNWNAQHARFKFAASVSGQDLDGWHYFGRYSWTGYGVHNPQTDGFFFGTGSTVGCIYGQGCRRNRVVIEVNAGSGEWELHLDVATVGTAVTGAATAVHSNGRTFSYTVRGRYSAKTDQTMLTLTGTGSGYGSRLSVAATGNLIVLRVTGKLLGQAVKHPQY
jgi:hypothetical protein